MLRLALVATLMLACVPARAADADATLNARYKALLDGLGVADAGRLREAQRAWIAFRDRECAFKAQGRDDATAANAARDACLEELTRQRADQLGRELDCEPAQGGCVRRKAGATAAATATGCAAEVGAARAERYVAQCQQVSPATHPPCNVANPCGVMLDEIRRSCAMFEKDAPAFCAGYR